MAKGWLDNYGIKENENNSSVSLPEGFVGMGNNTKGRNYSPAWGGQFQEGGEIPMAQKGYQTSKDSVAHQADKILKYEQLKGGPGGAPLPEYADPKYKKMLMDKIYPEVNKIMPNASAMEKGEAMDFIFNAGWDKNNNKITKDPRAFALQEYYRQYDKSKLDADGKWSGRKNPAYSFDQEYANTIGKLSENQRRLLMNKGRDWYYKNINNPSPGVPSSDYNDTWYGRIWNTNDYNPFNPNNPKFTPKKQMGGNVYPVNYVPQAQEGIDLSEYDIAMRGMMKSKIGMGNAFGNPAIKRMSQAMPKTGMTPEGIGTHYMGSMDNYAVPLLQDFGGDELRLVNPNTRSREAIRFNSPEEAQYFAEHYKDVAPMSTIYKGLQEYAMGGSIPGAVGFSYARTNNPAPSNGPYAKKTMASAKSGKVIKDDRGQWAHPGEITEIDSPYITMQGVPYPVLGISDTGDTQMMYPEEEYEFDGTKVTEFPMAKNGLRQEQKGLVNLDNLLNFTNYNTKQPGGWLDKY